jgi:hypothetical protein
MNPKHTNTLRAAATILFVLSAIGLAACTLVVGSLLASGATAFAVQLGVVAVVEFIAAAAGYYAAICIAEIHWGVSTLLAMASPNQRPQVASRAVRMAQPDPGEQVPDEWLK